MKVYKSPDYSAWYPEKFPWEKCTGQLAILGKLISKDIKQKGPTDRAEGLRDALAYVAGLAEVKR